MRIVISVILSLFSVLLIAQTEEILSYTDYIKIVKENHPVMYQSQLLRDMADGNSRMARGGFDPKIEGSWNHKSFDDKNYYSLVNGALKIPTWYGIDLKAGYDHNSGIFLNESDNLPRRGLWSAGISVPLGRGLVIDERRAALRKAEIYQQATTQEQRLIKNDILYQASIAYLEWQTAKANLEVAIDGVILATTKHTSTRENFLLGDKPAVDTIETFVAIQSRILDQQKAEQEYENEKLGLLPYLWIEGTVPLELAENAMPEPLSATAFDFLADSLVLQQPSIIAAHPELLLYDYKTMNIELEQRLAREDLKPDIRVDYNPLVGVAEDALFDDLNPANFKLRTTISYPIFQRKERGKIQINQTKLETVSYDRAIKQQKITTNLDQYNNNIEQTSQQYQLLVETTANYNRLLEAENEKFSFGESSVFLVNSRELKFLDSQYKLVETLRKLIFNRLVYIYYTNHATSLR